MLDNNIQNNLVNELKERAKELNCLYRIQELVGDQKRATSDILQDITSIIPQGWQYPDICCARIEHKNNVYTSEMFQETSWMVQSEIIVQEREVGVLQVYYTEERPNSFEGPFLKEEIKLINTISEQIGAFLFFKQLKSVFDHKNQKNKKSKAEWWVILDMLKKTDTKLLARISRKMVNYLCWKGVQEAESLFEYYNPFEKDASGLFKESNAPYRAVNEQDVFGFCDRIFDVSEKHLEGEEILDNISRWMKHDQSNFLVDIMGNMGAPLDEINNVLERFHHLKDQGLELTPIREKNLKVNLIRRLLSDQTDFLQIAKRFISIEDIIGLIGNSIYPINSYGKLGGKSAGLFLAGQILRKSEVGDNYSKQFKIPKTYYIVSDGLLSFMKYNSLEDIADQKYKDIQQVRKEFPYVSHLFKNTSFSPDMTKKLMAMLDDFGTKPLVVRSTSLLEDRQHAIFAGKYKSLFISNQGSKEERLAELSDAIGEVYASTFGPDPIEYRLEKDLLDYNEEMGIMIQEVVGKKVGKYFFPAFAGVAFSQNNHRWSSRLVQEDGMVRLVPGLGTRAVDRLSDDYPILFAPGNLNLRANITYDEIVRYSPKRIDVIDLEERSFKTLKIDDLLSEVGKDYPIINHIISAIDGSYIQQVSRLKMNFKNSNYIVTFNGVLENTDFVKQINSMIKVLENEFSYPVDVEFAHDGEDLFLLQCRPQSYGEIATPCEIPSFIPDEQLVFSANKFVSNGHVTDITHIVYVDPQSYGDIQNHEELLDIGRAVGKLNQLLPKRQFILMGPGRWGSRGDIKLGVSVTYSEINNTSLLIEIARKKNDYVPELSFGTHFFQDLVEANILYLPLYPDDHGNVFNEEFFNESKNILSDLLPELAKYESVIKVIDIQSVADGQFLNVLMNGDESKAIAMLTNETPAKVENKRSVAKVKTLRNDFYWKWRMDAASQIASEIIPTKFGVKNFYVFGSTKNATASTNSDIDLLIHFIGSKKQKDDLLVWLKGWESALTYHYLSQTGIELSKLLDVHIVTDEDIKNKDSFALKIGAITDAAKPLPMGT